MKKIMAMYSPPKKHWVGDGFLVRSLFSYECIDPSKISPFLLLDYAGPDYFTPSKKRRGVGQHPHRGFETVTIVYDGELEHRDSTGNGGLIGKGDVQWMTAGAGIIHEELHSQNFTKRGGILEMVQLWINLPAEYKSEPAAYQTILDSNMPRVVLGNKVGILKVIAGKFHNQTGPAKTFTPVNLWDIEIQKEQEVILNVPSGHNVLMMVRKGTVIVNNKEVVTEAQLVIFNKAGTTLLLTANEITSVLLLTGEPINEPVVGMGPYVMNTREEIELAVKDYRHGRFGKIKL